MIVRNTHLFGPEAENMDAQRPNKIILNPCRSEIPHLFGPQPYSMDKQRPKKLFCTLDLDGQTYPIYFALTQDYRYTMPKQNYCEPLTVRNTPSI